MNEEYLFIKEQVYILLYDFPHYITEPDYKNKLVKYIEFVSLDFMKKEDLNYLIENELDTMLKEMSLERVTIFNENKNIVSREHIEYLKNINQPQQRTKEWYYFRRNHITASNAWKGYSESIACNNQLIYEKIKPHVEHSGCSLCENAFAWGHKYEPLSCKIYEMRNEVVVSEFGCIEHPEYKFLAASPDGIITSDKYFGRMIEIKNVVSRVINGNPKKDYYIQMQLQMEVCDLDECDFVETKFIEYENIENYMEDGNINYSNENKEKGIIKVYIKNNEEYVYDYMSFDIKDIDSMNIWLDEYKEELVWVKNVYWKLDVYSCVNVPRCKFWFQQTIHKLKSLWDIILTQRETNNYKTYEPKKRKKESVVEINQTCLIKMFD